jgi:hypothetical protein
LQTICATFRYAIGAYTVGTVFSDTQTFFQAICTTFGLQVATKASVTFDAAVVFFTQQRLWVALWQGEGVDGQTAQDQCGENVLFHVQAPREGGLSVSTRAIIRMEN